MAFKLKLNKLALPRAQQTMCSFVFFHEITSKFMAFKLHIALNLMLHTWYIYTIYLWPCDIDCSYSMKWSFHHPNLYQSHSSPLKITC